MNNNHNGGSVVVESHVSTAIANTMSSPEKSIDYEGIKVVYDSYGHGGNTALVFVHGWSCASVLWSPAQAPLFQNHRSIVIDLPGHGRSDAPRIEYSLELFARAVQAVLQSENVTKAILIGHSMGGPVSTMVLRLFPDLVSGIIYVDSFFNLPENYLTQSQRKELAERHADDEKFRTLLQTIFKTKRTTQAVMDRVLETMMGTAKHVRTNATTTIAQPHTWKYDEVYQIPALLIVTPRHEDIDRHWLHHIPQLKISVWKDNGHFLFMEDPELFNSEVEKFLTEHDFLQS